jgi:hypothetical protein
MPFWPILGGPVPIRVPILAPVAAPVRFPRPSATRKGPRRAQTHQRPAGAAKIQPVCDLRATAVAAGSRYGVQRRSNGEYLRCWRTW